MSFNMTLIAQKDTTEFEIGKKKLLIIDKKTQKENAIYNLEKGKESFEKEIEAANELISKQKALLIEREKLIIEKEKLISESERLHGKTEDLAIKKAELEKLKVELELQKANIEANKKKKIAFQNGIIEIERGIDEIEKGLAEINDELNEDGNDIVPLNKSIKKHFNAHIAGFQFGIFNFLNKSQSIANETDAGIVSLVPEKSFYYDLKIFEYNIPLTKYNFGIATGAGIQWNSMNLEQNILLKEDENGVLYGEIIDTSNKIIKKNKLNAVYITIPVVVEYQVPIKKRKLYLNVGVFGGIRAWSKQKQVYKTDGVKYKDKKVDDFQLSPFRYGVMAGAGYDDLGIFIEYSIVPLFKHSKGPELYPISAGLRLDF